MRAESSSQGAVGLITTLLSPPLGSCPKCGFSGEPARFLRNRGQVASGERLRSAVIGTEDPSSSKGKQVNRGRREGRVSLFRPSPSAVGFGDFYRSQGADEGLQRRSVKDGVTSDFPP